MVFHQAMLRREDGSEQRGVQRQCGFHLDPALRVSQPFSISSRRDDISESFLFSSLKRLAVTG